MRFEKYRNGGWAVYDNQENLICITVYKKGAVEVIRRFGDATPPSYDNRQEIIHKEIKQLSKQLQLANKQLQQLASNYCID